MDSRAQPVALPTPGTARRVTEVRNHGAVVAAIVHDEGLVRRPELVEAGAAMAAVVLDNQRLAAQAEVSIRELRRSRARIASSAERERRRIERDLHDGAQQRLVALRIELELAGGRRASGPRARRRTVCASSSTSWTRRSRICGRWRTACTRRCSPTEGSPTRCGRSRWDPRSTSTSTRRGSGRYAPEVESAVYFCVLEALQNVLKHAGGARRVRVRVAAGPLGELHFSVRDDGAGIAGLRPGAGITNMQDRLAAFGGDVTVTSTPGVGTHVRGRVPASPLPVA